MTRPKSVVGLQRVLDIFWMVHNFVRSHFTTREVPAVALGIIGVCRIKAEPLSDKLFSHFEHD
jgi:hypothetical protein